MHKRTRAAALALAALSLFAAGWWGRGLADRRAEKRARLANAARERTAGFEIELWAKSAEHPAQSAFGLDGQYGLIEKGGRVLNRNSQVDFQNFSAGAFTAGIQGGEKGQVVDLGFVGDLERRFGGPPLEVLRWRDGALVVEGEEIMEPLPIPAPAAPKDRTTLWVETVLRVPPPEKRDLSAPVALDHVYFVQIVGGRSGELQAVMQVLEFEPARRVKVRCVPLR